MATFEFATAGSKMEEHTKKAEVETPKQKKPEAEDDITETPLGDLPRFWWK